MLTERTYDKRIEKENTDKALRTLSLCKGAGCLVIGTPAVCTAMRDFAEKKKKTRPYMVMIAEDISESTYRKLRSKTEFYHVELCLIPTSGERMAQAAGKTGVVAAVAITDGNFIRAFHLTEKTTEI